MEKKDEDDFLVGGDSVIDAVGAMTRAISHLKIRALAAQRRYERTKDPTDEHGFLLSCQEYYYVSRLRHDFLKHANEMAAQHLHDMNEKKNTVN